MNVIRERMAAKIDGDFVVFIIGARVHGFWAIFKARRVGVAMDQILTELEASKPDSGYLGGEQWRGREPVLIQYWRSVEHLTEYARKPDGAHFPAWVDFNKTFARSGELGIWHETFVVRSGDYECIYHHMPRFGLARAAEMVPATGRNRTARGRLGETDGTDHPVDEDGEAR